MQAEQQREVGRRPEAEEPVPAEEQQVAEKVDVPTLREDQVGEQIEVRQLVEVQEVVAPEIRLEDRQVGR